MAAQTQNEIYIWGAGFYGEKALRYYKDSGMNITGFIDSNEAYWYTEKLGLVIYPPKEILQKNNIQIQIAVVNEAVSAEIAEICRNANVKNIDFHKLRKQQIIDSLPDIKPVHRVNSPQYIVSLTSYGKRLAATAPYAIATILQQTAPPDKIILYVAHNDKENIPPIMEKLTEKGLEIRFVEDTGSYKKLIYALQEFPDDYIITADDDVFYPKNWFEQLLAEHQKHRKKIICHRAHGIKVDENHNPVPYINWDSCIDPEFYFAHVLLSQEQSVPRHLPECVFPTGVAGILYPPHCLYKDITNKELFMKLAPKADDVWFWAMAVINKEYFGDENPYIVVENGYSRNLQDIEPSQAQGENALWSYNSMGGNDRQLKAVIERYPQIREVLNKIDKFCYGVLSPCGFVMELDTTDWIQKHICEKGCYEKTDVLTLLSLMPADGIFFDIGANIGVYSLNLCKKAKDVYSFEATEKTYEHLLKTISANGIKNIRHNFNAVHCESGIEIKIWQGNKVLGNDNNGNNNMFSGGVMANSVKSVSIDDFVRNNNIQRMDIVKIDIEGNELNALKGAKGSILRFRPVILCEINHEMNAKAGYSSEVLFDFIVETLNYIPTLYLGNNFSLANKKNIVSSQHNVFFFPKENGIPTYDGSG